MRRIGVSLALRIISPVGVLWKPPKAENPEGIISGIHASNRGGRELVPFDRTAPVPGPSVIVKPSFSGAAALPRNFAMLSLRTFSIRKSQCQGSVAGQPAIALPALNPYGEALRC